VVQGTSGYNGFHLTIKQAATYACSFLVAPLLLWSLSDSNINKTILVCAMVLYLVVMMSVMLMLSHGTRSLLNPMLFAACTYFVPAAIGAVNLAFSMPIPLYSRLLPEYEHSIIIAIAFQILGYVSLFIGFSLCKTTFATKIAHHLPEWKWTYSAVTFPALIILALGDTCRLIAFNLGSVGFANEVSVFGSTFYFLSGLGTFGAIMTSSQIFAARKVSFRNVLLSLTIFVHCIFIILTSGGKGGPISLVLMILLAYYVSGHLLGIRGVCLLGIIAIFAILGGVAYGMGFRQHMGEERKASISEYYEMAESTINDMSRIDVKDTLKTAVDLFLFRVDATTSLAIVIDRRDELKGAEDDYGLSNNIVNDLLSSLIPRAIWNSKPNVADAREMSYLYFNATDTSYAFSFIGDLYRNGGMIAVIVGMGFLGAALRLGYQIMVVASNSIWSKCTYCVLIIAVNYEGLYSGITPILIRSGLVCVMACLFIEYMIKTTTPRSTIVCTDNLPKA
jgi:hypothetical protein